MREVGEVSVPVMTMPRPRARPTSGCTCDPPWPLLYTTPDGTTSGGDGAWRQVFPAPVGHTGAAWCIGCGAPYTGPWLPRPR